MDTVDFGNTFSKARQLILWVFLFQIIVLLATGLIFYLGGNALLTAIEILAATALVIFLFSAALLGVIYLRQPEVKERYRLKKQMRRNEVELGRLKSNQEAIEQKREAVQSHSQQERSAEMDRFAKVSQSIQEELQLLGNAREQEINSAVAYLQKNHIDEGLKNIPVDPALIPGIGDVLSEKLTANGINSARDVSMDTIQRIAGFGESKALSLYRWRESEENKLIATQPSQLSTREQAAIDGKYQQQMDERYGEARQAKAAYEAVLQTIAAQESSEMGVLSETEKSTGLAATRFATQNDELRKQFTGYRSITLARMFSKALIRGESHWIKRAGASGVLILFIIAGLINIIIFITAWGLSRSS